MIARPTPQPAKGPIQWGHPSDLKKKYPARLKADNSIMRIACTMAVPPDQAMLPAVRTSLSRNVSVIIYPVSRYQNNFTLI
jgi:hypothetical protein